MVSRAPRALQIALSVLALALLGAGAWLRAITAPWHTNVWAIDWLSYYAPQADALARGDVLGAYAWEGLHPPVSGLIHGALMATGATLWMQWAATVVAGLLAVVVLRRLFDGAGPADAGFFALLVCWIALSPLQTNYGLNTSPYPWTLLFVAGSIAALVHARAGRPTDGTERREPTDPAHIWDNGSARWVLAALLTGLAVQTHVLALAVAAAQGAWLLLQGRALRRKQTRGLAWWFGLVALCCLPVLVVAVTRTTDPWTFHIEATETPWWITASMVFEHRFGERTSASALGLLLALGAAASLVLAPRGPQGLLALCLVGWIAALAVFLELGVADPRLSHYFLVPQLLAFALAAYGWRDLVWLAGEERWGRIGWRIVGLLAVVTAWWATDAVSWQLDRAQDAASRMASSAPVADAIQARIAGAQSGDVTAYLWDHRFLNDEPEHLDPIAARWPLDRIGPPCRDIELTRGLCTSADGATLVVDPAAWTGPLDEFEEPLRLLLNAASPPGSLTVFLLPAADAPPAPWPTERWMAAHGGTREDLGHGVVAWVFPSGARAEEQPQPPVAP